MASNESQQEIAIFSQAWFEDKRKIDENKSECSEKVNSDRSVKTTRTNITYVPN